MQNTTLIISWKRQIHQAWKGEENMRIEVYKVRRKDARSSETKSKYVGFGGARRPVDVGFARTEAERRRATNKQNRHSLANVIACHNKMLVTKGGGIYGER